MEEGHINDTFKIIAKGGAYVLQKKNAAVFTNMAALLFNLQQFILSSSHPIYSTLFFKVSDGNLFFTDIETKHWILMKFVEGRKAITTEAADLVLLGQAVGSFLKSSQNLDQQKYKETLPSFHDINFRLFELDEAIKNNVGFRKESADPLLKEITSARSKLLAYKQSLDKTCEMRICHNDTKSDNIIINRDQAILLDLDTIMPGYMAYDFGDALRSLFSTGQEDQIKLKSAEEIKQTYIAFRKGFLNICQYFISNSEDQSLEYAPQYMCYLMGSRFLTDYLNGDVYYKTTYEDQNLRRAEGQLRLANQLSKIDFKQ